MIVAGSMPFPSVPGPSQFPAMQPQFDAATARSVMMRNISGVFEGKHEWPAEIKSEVALELGANYAYGMQQFVLAHEIGHLSSHSSRTQMQWIRRQGRSVRGGGSSISLGRKNWSQTPTHRIFATN